MGSVTRPDPLMHTEYVLLWMICWPWNLVWTMVVHNPLTHIVQFALVELRTTLEEISNSEFKDIERDFAISEPAPVPLSAANRLADELQRPPAQSRAPVTRSGPVTPPTPVTRPGLAASKAAPAYVPPPPPPPLAAAPAEPDQWWLSHADDQPKSTHVDDTAWLKGTWYDNIIDTGRPLRGGSCFLILVSSHDTATKCGSKTHPKGLRRSNARVSSICRLRQTVPNVEYDGIDNPLQLAQRLRERVKLSIGGEAFNDRCLVHCR